MRVLLIEDDSVTAQSIELMFRSESFDVCVSHVGAEGSDLAKLYDYDIILLDLVLTDISGYEVLRTLRAAKIKTPILVLSGLSAIKDKVKALGLGADDYMTKPFHKGELIARIRAVVRRSQGYALSVVQSGGLTVNFDHRTVEVDGTRVNLTTTEYRILEHLSLRKGTPLTKEMISVPTLRWHRRTRDQDHRRIYLQVAQEAGECVRRQELHRDSVGTWLCPAPTN